MSDSEEEEDEFEEEEGSKKVPSTQSSRQTQSRQAQSSNWMHDDTEEWPDKEHGGICLDDINLIRYDEIYI
jgi:hypothetical protein